jgi:nicotinate-nucleotide pyrophosphorylase (carboxylating)
MVPANIVLDPMLAAWLQEDIGRGDRTTDGLGDLVQRPGQAHWVAKAPGVIAGLPIAARVFQLLSPELVLKPLVAEGTTVEAGTAIAQLTGPLWGLLTGERVALNLAMPLSGIATATREYVNKIVDLTRSTGGYPQNHPWFTPAGKIRHPSRGSLQPPHGAR